MLLRTAAIRVATIALRTILIYDYIASIPSKSMEDEYRTDMVGIRNMDDSHASWARKMVVLRKARIRAIILAIVERHNSRLEPPARPH